MRFVGRFGSIKTKDVGLTSDSVQEGCIPRRKILRTTPGNIEHFPGQVLTCQTHVEKITTPTTKFHHFYHSGFSFMEMI